MDKRKALAIRQSEMLMEAANGRKMTKKQFAEAIGQSVTSVNHTLNKLLKYGLPVPEIKRQVYTSRFRDEASLPSAGEPVDASLYSEGLQVLPERTRIVDGRTVYMLR